MFGVHWQQLGEKFLLWVSLELVLNFMGIDDLADYAEFRLGRQRLMFEASSAQVSVVQPSLEEDNALHLMGIRQCLRPG